MSISSGLGINVTADTSQAEGALSSLGSKLGGLGGLAGGVAAAGVLGLTAAVVGVGVAAVGVASDYGAATALLSSQTGAVGEELESLGNVARTVFEQGFGDSAKDAAASVALVKQSFTGIGDDELAEVTQAALTMKDVFGTDVTEAIRGTSVAAKAFGIDGVHAMDIVTRVMQRGGDTSGDLLDTFQEYSPLLKDLGFSAEDFGSVLVRGAEAGARNYDLTADTLKEFNIRVQDGSKGTVEAFKTLGISNADFVKGLKDGSLQGPEALSKITEGLAKITDPIERNTAGVALFGTKWEDMTEAGIMALGNISGGLDGVEGATKKAGDAIYNNIGARWTAVSRQAMGALEPIGQGLMGIASDALTAVIPAIEGVTQAVKDVIKGFQMNGLGGGVGTGAMLLLQALGMDEGSAESAGMKVADTINGLVEDVQSVILGFQMNGLGGGAGAGAGVIAKMLGLDADAAAEVTANVSNIVTQVSGALKSLMAIFGGGDKDKGELQLAEILKNNFGEAAVKPVIDFVHKIQDVGTKISDIAKAFTTAGIAGVIAQEFGGEALAGFYTFEKAIKNVADSAKAGAFEVLALIGGLASGFETFTSNAAAMTALKVAAEAVAIAYGVHTAAMIITNAQMIILTTSTNTLALAKRALAFATGTVAGQLGILGLAVLGTTEALGALYNNNKEVNQTLKDLSPTLAKSTKELSGMEVAAALVGDAFKQVTGIIDLWNITSSNASKNVARAIDSMVTEVSYALMQMANQARAAGQAVVDGLVSMIQGGVGAVGQAARNLAQGAIDAIKAVVQPGSPSKVTEILGRQTAQGFIKGITDLAPDVRSAIDSILNAAIRNGSLEGLDGAIGMLNQEQSQNTLKLANALISDPELRKWFEGLTEMAVEGGHDLVEMFARAMGDQSPTIVDAGMKFAASIANGIRNGTAGAITAAVDLARDTSNAFADSMRQFNAQWSFDFMDQRDFDHWQAGKANLPGLQNLLLAPTGPSISVPQPSEQKIRDDMMTGLNATNRTPGRPVVNVNVGLDQFGSYTDARVNLNTGRSTDRMGRLARSGFGRT